jgi:hypothetical protein
MGDDQQGRGALQHARQHLAQGLGVEGGEAFVEDEAGGALQYDAGDVEAATLSLRELSAGLAQHLQQVGREILDASGALACVGSGA